MMSHSSCNHDEKNILRKDLADIISEYITNHQNPKIVRLYVCHIGAYSGDSRSPIPMISVHSVGDFLYRRQS